MPTTLDCTLLRDLFGSAEMREIFDSRALLQSWLDAEVALAEAEAELGIIPAWAADQIRRAADASAFDLDELRAGLAESQHPLVPVLRALVRAGGEGGHYAHWGATTQDVMDTGLILQLRRALDVVERDLAAIREALADLALRHRDTPMPGRTHGQHAVPITFGLKVAVWLAELGRTAERLGECRRRVLVGQLAGAAGTLASLGARAGEVREAFCRRLGLTSPPTPWHSARDGLAELVSVLALLAATMEKIALEVIRLQATEVGELAEPFEEGHVGSSTMPQKRNPMVCETIAATCKLIRGLAPVMHGCMVGVHERDMSTWAAEWLLLPQALIMTGGALAMFRRVVEGLEVDEERMAANLELTRGRITAEGVMLAVAEHLGREHAHDLLMELSRKAEERRVGLAETLREDGRVTEVIPAEELERLLDPGTYLGESARIVEAAVGAYGVGGLRPGAGDGGA